jgi:ketosteroid isomerase-like protein
MSETTEQSQNRAAITDVISRYAQAVDTADIDSILGCFSPEARIEYNAGAIVLNGHEELRTFLSGAAMGPSTHLMSNILVTFDAEGARAETSAVAFVTRNAGFVTVRGLHYSDRCALLQGRWLITYRRHSAHWEFAVPARALS